MKKTFLLALFYLSCACMATAQETITGWVYDKQSGQALSGVNVIGYQHEITRVFSATDLSGKFILPFSSTNPLTSIRFTHMGYKFHIHPIVPDKKEITIFLEEAPLNLKALVVKPKPIVYRNDTTIYDATAFSRSGDRTIGEVINRLPDASVSSQGAIKIQGVNINRFYIEDMDLLGGKYGIAVRNLRPEDIASIEVYENHQPILALKEVEPSRQAAMNIRLKEKAKAKWLLSPQAAAGYGDSLIYSAGMNAMRFGKKNQSIFLAKANNNGENIASELKIQSLQPGTYRLEELTGLENNFNIRFRTLPIKPEQSYLNQTQLASANVLYKRPSGYEIKGNASFIANRLDEVIYASQQYDLPDGSQVHLSEQTSGRLTARQVNGEITIQRNTTRKYFENQFSLEGNWDDYSRLAVNKDSVIGNQYTLPRLGLKNKFSLITNRSGKPFRFESRIDFRQADQSLTIRSNRLLPLFGQKEARQQYAVRTLHTDHFFSFSRKIKKISTTYVLGMRLNYEHLASSGTPVLSDREIPAGNALDLFWAEPYLNGTLHYNSPKWQLQLTLPLRLRYDRCAGGNHLFFLYSPYLYLKYDLSAVFALTGTVSAGNRLKGVEQYASGYIFNDYRNASAPQTLQASTHQRYYVSLQYRDVVSGIRGTLSADYTSTENPTMSDFFYKNTLFKMQTGDRSRMETTSFGLNLSYNPGLGIFTFRAGGRYNTGENAQMLQGEMYRYQTRGYQLHGSLNITPASWLYVNYDFDYTQTELSSKSEKRIRSYSHKIDAVVTPVKSFDIKSRFHYYSQYAYEGDPVGYPFLDVSLNYALSKKIRFFLNANNLLNTKEYTLSYFSGVSSRLSVTALRGREFLAGISFSL